MAGQSDPHLNLFSAEEVSPSCSVQMIKSSLNDIDQNSFGNSCPGGVCSWRWNGGDYSQYENGFSAFDLCMSSVHVGFIAIIFCCVFSVFSSC